MLNQREWIVSVTEFTEHEYDVVARTEEEAISIAEDLLDQGDDGHIIDVSIDSSEAIPADEIQARLEDEEEVQEFLEEDEFKGFTSNGDET